MANLNLNKVILGGRLIAEPELKQTQSGVSVLKFTMAINRKYSKDDKQEADFISCVAWRQTAEFIDKCFDKGSSICITGSIQTRKWDGKDGKTCYATEVVVDEAMFVDSKNEARQSVSAPYMPDAYKMAEQPKFEEIDDKDDLPF